MTTRKELVQALRQRYRSAALGDRIKILDEFVALTDYHRKHAIRVLREGVASAKEARARNRLYDEAVRQALTVLWEAADRVCGKRLKALIPLLVDAMERHLWRRTLRRRSEKDGMTWERITKIAAAWLPPPRILHPWPDRRFAVKHPMWEPSA